MFRRIVRHELRSLFADRVVWIAAVGLFLLAAYGVRVGHHAAERQAEQVAAAMAEESERYDALRAAVTEVATGNSALSPFQDPSRPYVAGRQRGRRYAVLPTAPFQASAVGQSDLIPPVVPVILDGADPRAAREEIENPVHLLAGPLDLAFVVVFLLPLLALTLSFDLISREREGGTLGLLLAQPVSVRRITAAKLTARWGLLMLLVVAVTIPAFMLVGAPLPAGSFLVWTAIVGLYLAFWVGLAGLVNATGRDSARNAVVLAFLWLVFVILVPGAVQIGAGLLHPVPSRAEMVAVEREELREVQGQASAVLAQYYNEHPELVPAGSVDEVDFQTRAFAVNEAVRERLQPLRNHHREQLQAQQRFIQALKWSSPAILTHQVLIDLAGTGDHRLERFEEAVAGFHARWVEFFGPMVYADDRLEPGDLDRIPDWDFQDEALGVTAALVFPGLLGLLLSAGVITAAGLRLLRGGRDRPWD